MREASEIIYQRKIIVISVKFESSGSVQKVKNFLILNFLLKIHELSLIFRPLKEGLHFENF